MSTPRNKVGHMAIVKKSTILKNVGKIVTIDSLLGYFNEGEKIVYNNIEGTAWISDFFFWVSCPSGFETKFGPTSKGCSPDTWLEPLNPDLLGDEEIEDYGTHVPKVTVEEDDLVKI